MTADVMRALFDHAALLKTTGPMLQVAFPEGKTFEAPADGKYLKVSFFPNAPKWRAVSLGKINQGLLQISVIWPKKQGLVKPGRVVDQIKEHFAKETVLRYNSTKVVISDEPWEAAVISEDANIAIPVTIPWAS